MKLAKKTEDQPEIEDVDPASEYEKIIKGDEK